MALTQRASSGGARDLKAELVLAILEACDEEGEDLPFAGLLAAVCAGRPEFKHLADKLMACYGDLPPRVALAQMAKDQIWREAVEKASKAYLSGA